MTCTDRCRNAKKESRCVCSCGGDNHAKYSEEDKMNDKIMDVTMGGEVASFIEKWENKTIRCYGVCRKDRVMDVFYGYPHDGGLADAQGNKWWVYFKCPTCKYGHSFSKMEFFLRHTEIEIKAENE